MQDSLKLSAEVATDGRIRVSVEQTSATSISCDAWLLRVENSDGDLVLEPFRADGRNARIDLPRPASLLLRKDLRRQRVVVEGVRKVTTSDDDDVRSCYVIVSSGKASLQPAAKCLQHDGDNPAGVCASRSLTGVSAELSAEQTISGQNVVHIRSSEVPDLWQVRLLRRTLDQCFVLVDVFYFGGSSSRFEVPLPLEPEMVYAVEADGLVQVGGGGGGGGENAEDKSDRSFLILCSASTTLTGGPIQTTLDKYEVDLKVEQTTYREADVLIQNRNKEIDRRPEFWLLTINQSDTYRIPGNETKFRIPGRFDAGLTYSLRLRGMLEVKGERSRTEAYVIPWQKNVKFKAELTPSDIRSLLRKAVDMESSDFNDKKRCVQLYRNKSPEYFDQIFRNNGGIMAVRPKDNSGDPGSPINGGRLKGLFFMASVDCWSSCGDPIPVSPFGSTRICVEADRLVNESLNVYFADFYCMKPDSYHYVTLVVTKPDSEVDLFCARRLVRISLTDQSENPFLFLDDQSHLLHVTARHSLLVEVFYTEDLDIGDYEETLEHDVRPVGMGSTSKAGKRKNPFCTICNLYPRCES